MSKRAEKERVYNKVVKYPEGEVQHREPKENERQRRLRNISLYQTEAQERLSSRYKEEEHWLGNLSRCHFVRSIGAIETVVGIR
jgi:hypothetical protein